MEDGGVYATRRREGRARTNDAWEYGIGPIGSGGYIREDDIWERRVGSDG
jgi:hypothetical protein